MKQVVQSPRDGALSVLDVPAPILRPPGILVRTRASLVSAGTERAMSAFARKNLLAKARARPDLVRRVRDKARRDGLLSAATSVWARLDQPMPLGYSLAGEGLAVGVEAGAFHVGERVACAGAGYANHAEVVYVPRHLAVPLPDSVSDEAGAFVTLGAIALQGIRQADVKLGDRVAVIGLGLIGQIAAQILRAAGCRVLSIDLNPDRVTLARTLGAHEGCVNAEAEAVARLFTDGHGCDAVLIAADTRSSEPIALAGRIARDRAIIVAIGAVGLTIPRTLYYQKELDFRLSRSYGPGRYDAEYEEKGRDYPIGYVRWTEGRNMTAVVDLLATGALNVTPLITHRFPIADAPRAYAVLKGATALGVVLTFGGEGLTPASLLETLTPSPSAFTSPPAPSAFTSPPSPLSVITERGSRTMRLGVIGAGSFATATLLPAIRSVTAIERAAITSASGLSARAAADRFGFARAAADLPDMLADPTINWLAILTRHDQHAAQAIAALDAGKDVFVEKPLALNAESLAVVLAAQEKSGRRLMVGFNRRFAPMVRELRDFFGGSDDRSPLIGTCRVNAGALSVEHWTQDPAIGGGRLIGEAIHFVDLLTFLIGALPVRVYAAALPSTLPTPDEATITLHFADGSIGTIVYTAGGVGAFGKERIELIGDGKIGILDDYRRLDLIMERRRIVRRAWLRRDKGHRAEWAALAAIVASDAPAPIPLAEIAAVHRATFAIAESLRRGEPVLLGK